MLYSCIDRARGCDGQTDGRTENVELPWRIGVPRLVQRVVDND